MSDLVRAVDAPTHKLTVKLEDGTYRIFYLTTQEADWVAKNINSVEPNLVLPRSIDPDAPSFYPKRGAWMARMSDSEIADRRSRFVQKHRETVGKEQEEAAKAEHTKRIRAWVKENPERFEQMKQEAHERLQNGKGMYHAASQGTKKSLVHYEALRAVDEILTLQDQDGRKGTDVDPM